MSSKQFIGHLFSTQTLYHTPVFVKYLHGYSIINLCLWIVRLNHFISLHFDPVSFHLTYILYITFKRYIKASSSLPFLVAENTDTQTYISISEPVEKQTQVTDRKAPSSSSRTVYLRPIWVWSNAELSHMMITSDGSLSSMTLHNLKCSPQPLSPSGGSWHAKDVCEGEITHRRQSYATIPPRLICFSAA